MGRDCERADSWSKGLEKGWDSEVKFVGEHEEISSGGFGPNSTVLELWGVLWQNWAIHTYWGSPRVNGFSRNPFWVYFGFIERSSQLIL